MSGPYLEFTPTSEQEVVLLFGLLLPHLPERFVINEVRTAFPDCLATCVKEDGENEPVRIEFELHASNFIAHQHDPSGCDLIVCWEDDMLNFQVPRLALAPIARALENIFVNDSPKYEKKQWTRDSFLDAAPSELRTLHTELLDWASRRGRIQFGQGARDATWMLWMDHPVTGAFPPFGVYANGKAWSGSCNNQLPKHVETSYRQRLSFANGVGDAATKKVWFFIDLADPHNGETLRSAVDALSHELDAIASSS